MKIKSVVMEFEWLIYWICLNLKKIKRNLAMKNEIFTKIYGVEPLDYDKILADYKGYIEKLNIESRIRFLS